MTSGYICLSGGKAHLGDISKTGIREILLCGMRRFMALQFREMVNSFTFQLTRLKATSGCWIYSKISHR